MVVGCYECHSLNPERHKDNFEHFDYRINVVVSPNDCKTCHPVEVDQYSGSKKAHALGNLTKNPMYSALVETILGIKEIEEGRLSPLRASEHTKWETCFACHGTEVTVKGTEEISTELGEVTVPDLGNWPNQEVGRINPDGSRGACHSTSWVKHHFRNVADFFASVRSLHIVPSVSGDRSHGLYPRINPATSLEHIGDMHSKACTECVVWKLPKGHFSVDFCATFIILVLQYAIKFGKSVHSPSQDKMNALEHTEECSKV